MRTFRLFTATVLVAGGSLAIGRAEGRVVEGGDMAALTAGGWPRARVESVTDGARGFVVVTPRA